MMKTKQRAILLGLICAMLFSGLLLSCGGKKLSADFDEAKIKSKAEEIITIVNSKDGAALRAQADDAVQKGLTDALLAQFFGIVEAGGAFEKIADMQVASFTNKESKEENAMVLAKAQYASKTYTFDLSFTKDLKLSGIYIK